MIKIYLSAESCASCQAASQGSGPAASTDSAYYAPGQSQTPDQKGFTYDNGNGVKTRVEASGPFATFLRSALNATFQKQPLIPNIEPEDGTDVAARTPEHVSEDPSVEGNIASEAMQQDVHMANLANLLSSDPEFEVVLTNFDNDHVNEHSAAVAGTGIYDSSKDPIPVDNLAPSSSINMYATNVEDIIQPRTQEIITDLSKDAPTVAFINLDETQEDSTDGFIAQVKASHDAQEVSIEAAVQSVLTRMIDNPNVHVCVGLEQFKAFLKR